MLCLCTIYFLGSHGSQERELDPLEQIAVSYHMGAGN